MMILKQEIKQAFLELLEAKIALLNRSLDELFESAKNETKSTAGDKHETALAHVQIAQKQAMDQKAVLQNNRRLLFGINALVNSNEVRLGSLAYTTDNCYFISTGIGKITLAGTVIYAIALSSPVGIILRGLKKGDTFSFNGKTAEIIDIL